MLVDVSRVSVVLVKVLLTLVLSAVRLLMLIVVLWCVKWRTWLWRLLLYVVVLSVRTCGWLLVLILISVVLTVLVSALETRLTQCVFTLGWFGLVRGDEMVAASE